MRIPTLALVLGFACAGCSPPLAQRCPPSESPAAKLLRADTLAERGCYLCLGDALTLYRQLITVGFRPPLVHDRIFRTSTLLAAREREVGIMPAGARTTLPVAAPAGSDLYTDVAAVIPWTGSKGPGSFSTTTAEVPPARVEEWRVQLDVRVDTGDALATYLLVALDCSYLSPPPSPAAIRAYAAAHPSALGLAFRVASCRPGDEEALRDIVHREPRFVEAEFLLGEMSTRKGQLGEAEEHYRRVVELLPRLTGAYVGLGDVLADNEEFEEALESYQHALAAAPDDRRALIGKARCLSNLGEYEAALAICNTVIRLGTWYLGPAHYWRAQNLHALHDLQGAWEAIEAAKRYAQTAEVFELSGVIAFDRHDIAQARADMDGALRSDNTACQPRFYLGLVHMDAHEWVTGASWFVQAAACYGDGASAVAQKVQQIERSQLSDARKALLRARYRKRIAASEHAVALAAYSAAENYANAGLIAQAISQAERAVRDPQLSVQAQALIARLRKD